MTAVRISPERPVLPVDVGGEREVGVPLTFTRAELEALGAAEDRQRAMMDFFRSYIGDDLDRVGDDDLAALCSAWAQAREALGEPGPGEPPASPS